MDQCLQSSAVKTKRWGGLVHRPMGGQGLGHVGGGFRGPGTGAGWFCAEPYVSPQLDLEEEASRRAMAQRSPAQRAWLYTLRGLVNLLVVALLGVAFYCIYLATEYSQSTLSQVTPHHNAGTCQS